MRIKGAKQQAKLKKSLISNSAGTKGKFILLFNLACFLCNYLRGLFLRLSYIKPDEDSLILYTI